MRFENLVVGQFNEMAVKALEMVIENPGRDYPVIIIQGDPGSGKSFLIKAFESCATNKLTIKSCNGSSIMNEMIQAIRDNTLNPFIQTLQNVDMLLIDDFQELSNRTGTQHCLDKTLKNRVENKKQTIITCSKPIGNIEGIGEELESFLMGSLVIEILEPDFEV